MKIVTLNAGLLTYDLLGVHLFTPTKFLKPRIRKLVRVLKESDFDIVCLQEVYLLRHKKYLQKKLKEAFPYCYFFHRAYKLAMENSLVILSKNPLKNVKLNEFKNNFWEERWFSKMGYISCSFEYQQRDVNLYNVHLTAGGIKGPEHQSAESLRQKQIFQLLEDIKSKGELSIIVGDLNCGHNVSKANFSLFLKNDFNLNYYLDTWDPENELNINGIHKNSAKQAIDYILFSKKLDELVEYDSFTLEFKKPVVEFGGRKFTVSDHYGVSVSFS
ncbi:MAG: endonuclease/exonuclease/phosphatase family protein [Bacteriovoracaceae bacterium]|jgi:sphingomyelin phosphodiesterase 2|nr:endonuclease/exonuclease/phosphatase family protein [Bacteriovoracaceae bacterium]